MIKHGHKLNLLSQRVHNSALLACRNNNKISNQTKQIKNKKNDIILGLNRIQIILISL